MATASSSQGPSGVAARARSAESSPLACCGWAGQGQKAQGRAVRGATAGVPDVAALTPGCRAGHLCLLWDTAGMPVTPQTKQIRRGQNRPLRREKEENRRLMRPRYAVTGGAPGTMEP